MSKTALNLTELLTFGDNAGVLSDVVQKYTYDSTYMYAVNYASVTTSE